MRFGVVDRRPCGAVDDDVGPGNGHVSALRAMTRMALLKASRFGHLWQHWQDLPEQIAPVDQDEPARHLVRGGGLGEEPLEAPRRVPAVHVGDRERCLGANPPNGGMRQLWL